MFSIGRDFSFSIKERLDFPGVKTFSFIWGEFINLFWDLFSFIQGIFINPRWTLHITLAAARTWKDPFSLSQSQNVLCRGNREYRECHRLDPWVGVAINISFTLDRDSTVVSKTPLFAVCLACMAL